jgi:hypothetical protein
VKKLIVARFNVAKTPEKKVKAKEKYILLALLQASSTSGSLKMRPIGCPETSERN